MTSSARLIWAEMKPLRVGLIGYDGVQALDIIGPSDAFTIAEIESDNGQRRTCYEVIIVGITNKPFRAESGVSFQPHTTLGKAPTLDTLIIPGGRGARIGQSSNLIAKWISSRAKRIRRIASVCTGVYALAPTGLLDGRRVTTHWRFANDVARRFPKLNVDHDALAVARELVVFLKRSGGQKQYSEPLEFQINSTDRFADLASWMVEHMRGDLSLDALAERVCLSPRHFVRRFKQAFGGTPAAFVENLRLDEARRRLSERTQTIENVASSVGFQSDDVFRRAFQRRFGVKPSSYRSRFDARAKSQSRRK